MKWLLLVRALVWLLLPFVALLASGLYYVLGAAPDVLITQRLQAMAQTATGIEHLGAHRQGGVGG